MNQLAVVNGQPATLPTIIGQAPARFPIGGKIRAGIKVLTQAAAHHPETALITKRVSKQARRSKRSRRKSRERRLT
jgi:hypothetical protein